MAREKEIDISTWYPSLSMMYMGKDLQNTRIVEDKIVNLWVDEKKTDSMINGDICEFE